VAVAAVAAVGEEGQVSAKLDAGKMGAFDG